MKRLSSIVIDTALMIFSILIVILISKYGFLAQLLSKKFIFDISIIYEVLIDGICGILSLFVLVLIIGIMQNIVYIIRKRR